MTSITATMARRKFASLMSKVRHDEPIAITSHGKTIAFVVGNALERDELLSDLSAIREGKEEVRRRGTIPAEKVFGVKQWKRAMKRAVSR